MEGNWTLLGPCRSFPSEALEEHPGQFRIQSSLMTGVPSEPDWTLVVEALAVMNCCRWDLETVRRPAAAASAGTAGGVAGSR